MFRTMSTIVFLLAFPISAMAEAPGNDVSVTATWLMSLDADGKIAALEPKGNVIGALREKIEPVVRTWKFEPGAVNGTPAATNTLLSVQVSLLPEGEETYAIRVDDVRTGGFVAEMSSPEIPRDELPRIRRSGGFVQLVYEVSYDNSGTPTRVVAVEGSMMTKGKLVEAGESALRSWQYAPERVAGIGVPGKLLVPICYSVGMSPKESQRNADKCTWKHPGSNATLKDGQSLALESSVQLKSEVIGSIL